MLQVTVYYLLSFGILVYYGVEVCPYLEQITIPKLALIQGMFFIPGLLLQFYLDKKWVIQDSFEFEAKRLFILNSLIFIAIGFGIAIYNMLVYGDQLFASVYDSVVSGLKVVLGTTVLGFFSTIDIVLKRERNIIRGIISRGDKVSLNAGFFSLPKKVLLVTLFGGIFIVMILLLLIVKDFQWLRDNIASYGIEAALKSVIFEVIFVIVILFAFGIKIIISYSKNLNLYFSLQTKVLGEVAEGKLDSYVPVFNNDEFGFIASRTNDMIDDLKEKNRIKTMFGKVMSPVIVDRIVHHSEGRDEGGVKMGGGKQELIVLFSDIRSFTALSEGTTPELLVEFLNKYFTRMVPIIQDNGGVIDKFIGDGILAVFGLDEQKDNYEAKAIEAAIQMHKAVEELNKETSLDTKIGIGLHKGDVIAGIIGSPDRLEFTFIGDVVNTAARLESLTKELGARILISMDLFDCVKDMEVVWTDYGQQALKGKQKLVSVMGIGR